MSIMIAEVYEALLESGASEHQVVERLWEYLPGVHLPR